MTALLQALETSVLRRHPGMELLGGGLLVLLLAAPFAVATGADQRYLAVVLVLYALLATLVWQTWPGAQEAARSGGEWRHWCGLSWLSLGPANRVTLVRALLMILVLSALPFPVWAAQQAWALAGLSLLALSLDGLDGWVARRTGSVSAYGARFDMEVDAAFIMGLALLLVVLERAGIWVLALGLMRYAFVLAGWRWCWLNQSLPPSFRRQFVCVWQVATLLACMPPWLPAWASVSALAVALVLLTVSFLTDVIWLYRQQGQSESP
ncbi:CDP-alcohol phosphatidyltransferase family protein [Natronospirillum operosum]|uniref:CDP-alcohol phosphatidyltransferase family protein n=1 Tax=Natronospirillum operosum TaxID=2759953 RepID=A0A4Z0WDU5_9GAMM|nr:CDP-alcohol phosphatidyltransferase family protein [Natronospirillum operosum]TGG92100.1 CDP-alcohol phosphatidyltransferase family protein [Natronospirillum operosum]